MFQEDISADKIKEMTEAPDPEKVAIKQLTKIVSNSGFKTLLEARKNKTHPDSQSTKLLIDQLPDFDADAIMPTEFLVEMGIWKQNPQNLDHMLES